MSESRRREEIMTAVRRLVADRLPRGFDRSLLTDTTRLGEGNILDSLGFVELVLLLEHELGRQLDEVEVESAQLETLQDIDRFVQRQLDHAG